MPAGKNDLLTRYGPWALVTGASSGIGKVFAHQLAALGFHLVIAARRLEHLEVLAHELEAAHEIKVVCLKVDLASAESTTQVLAACDGLKIGLLIHNAGSGIPGAFAECDLEEEKRMFQLNCLTPAELTRHFLPHLIAQGRGGIIFVSSLMGFQGVPFMANYSATKGYLLNFGEALHHECRDQGIDVLVLAPGATDTPGRDLHPVDYSKLPIRWMDPGRVVKSALQALSKRRALIIPGWRNHFTGCLSGGLWSRGLVQRIMARLARIALPLKK